MKQTTTLLSGVSYNTLFQNTEVKVCSSFGVTTSCMITLQLTRQNSWLHNPQRQN